METLNKDEISLIKKHPIETVLFIMMAGMSFLFYSYFDLSKEFRRYVTEDKVQAVKVIEDNNRLLNEVQLTIKNK